MTAKMTSNLLTPAPVSNAALARGLAVKFSSGKLVACGAGASSVGDRAIGFVQTAVTAADKPVELAVLGGGAVGIAAGTISAGAELKTNADGHLVATTTANDIVVAIAVESAVDNDVFAILPINPTKY